MDIRELLDRAGDTITVRRVFGEPYERDGLVVIPAARVQGGGGGGSGDQGAGGGGGFGVNARPVGAYLIKDGELTWRPAVDVNGMVQAAAMAFVALLLTVRAVAKARARAKVKAARA